MGQDLDDWILQRPERRSERPLNRSCCRCAPTDTHGGFPFARRAEDLPAPRMQGRWHEAVKNSAFLLNISFNFC